MTSRRRLFPLFWRIFLLIWLAMAVTIIASNLLTRELIDQERRNIERMQELRSVGQEAIRIRGQQGHAAMRRYLHHQGDELELRMALLEVGQFNERLPQSVRERMNDGWHRPRPAVLDFADGYKLVAWPKANSEGWLDPRWFRTLELILGFALVTLACWWVARLISRPLRHMEATARTIADGDRSLRVSGHIANRLDEIGAMATAFNGMTDQLCHLLDRQKHLLRDISHDLRTPLTRQRIAIELAADGGADPELMDSILRQNVRLDAMTGQILTLYQVLEHSAALEREAISPVQVVQRVLADAADYAEHRGVDCRLNASAQCSRVSVLADGDLLQRALDNVLQNALDHTPPGRVVHCTLKVDGDQLYIDIADQGPGVSADELGHLFEPFYRADQARSGEGWGLGLAIARDIVRAHDGGIDAGNGPQGGLTVSITLPVFTRG